MATETLTCKYCGDNWQRTVKRGRKPTKCPDCKGGKVKSEVNETKLKNAEQQYNRRVQMLGNHLQPLGDPETVVLSGREYTKYSAYEYDDGDRTYTVKPGAYLRQKGLSYRFKFQSLIVREDGTAYANLIGINREYDGKYRAIGVDKLTIA